MHIKWMCSVICSTWIETETVTNKAFSTKLKMIVALIFVAEESWFRGEYPTTSFQISYTSQTRCELKISNIGLRHLGTYSVEASNVHGVLRTTAALNVGQRREDSVPPVFLQGIRSTFFHPSLLFLCFPELALFSKIILGTMCHLLHHALIDFRFLFYHSLDVHVPKRTCIVIEKPLLRMSWIDINV